MKRKVIFFSLTAATLFASAALAVVAEQLFVSSESVDILSGKSGLSDTVKTVQKGTALDVLAHDEDGWLEVKTADAHGFVFKDSLSPDQPIGDFHASNALNTGIVAVNAGKGLGPETTKYATGKKLSTVPLVTLITFGKTINMKDLDDFATIGKVGKFKPAVLPQ